MVSFVTEIVDEAASESRVETGRFVPKRLWIDFKKGQWTGEYGL